MADQFEAMRAVLTQHQESLLDKANVVATGIGYKETGGQRTTELCVVCSVTRKQPAASLSSRDLLPAAVQGIPTDVIETGRIHALQSRTERFRPAPGGVSIGHRDITAGTLGCIVRRNGERLILSNNHVLANSNAAEAGDPILQPGPADGGRYPDDQIATLDTFVPIVFPDAPSDCSVAQGLVSAINALAAAVGSTTRIRAVRPQPSANLVDAALAKPFAATDIEDSILEIGELAGHGQAELGTAIKKSGRTTALTQGVIQQISVTVNVQYGGGRTATFTDQLLAGPMSQGGDSGSAVLDDQNRLVGLLFAGSDNTTIINRIEHVLDLLDISV